MSVENCVTKIKRNFNSSQTVTSEKETTEQTSLKVCGFEVQELGFSNALYHHVSFLPFRCL